MRRFLIVLIAAFAAWGCGGQPPGDAVALSNGSFTAVLNGFPIHYEVHGTGPLLIALPNSWGMSLEGLRGLYEPLESRFTMVYFDPRGMGQSGPVGQDADRGAAAVREDFDALRRHLGLGPVNAIGWSNGAMNLLLFALERPDSLASAILLHGVASLLPEDNQSIAEKYPEMIEGAQQMATLLGANVSDEEKNREIKDFYIHSRYPIMFKDRARGEEILERLYMDTEFSWRHAVYSQREWSTFDLRDRLGEIRIPCLIIAGAHDVLPPTRVWEMHEGIADSTFVIFDDSGHFSPVEEPDKFVETVTDFLGG